MNFINKKLCLRDFVPPIMLGPLKRVASLLRIPQLFKESTNVEPFISPALGSFSQFNEDLLIDLLYSSKNNGFYIDIGANDPSFNSNTKRFYDRGWSGINVEPGEDAFKKLQACRSRDINLNKGVGPAKDILTFYQVNGDSTLSSFSKKIASKMASKFGLTISEKSINVLRLVDIFEDYVKDNHVDILSIDAEGLDAEILQSNDWSRFRPSVIIVEIDSQYKEIIEYMHNKNYLLIYNNMHNGIFLDKLTTENNLKSIVTKA